MGIGRIETTVSEYITLTWANGIVKARANEKARFQDYVGWFTPVGQSNEFDKAMESTGFQIIEVQHSDAVKKHWNIGEALQFLPITMGTPAVSVPTLLRMAEKASEAGIGVRWPQGEGSKVGVVGYIKELADNGAYIAIKVGAHKLMCEHLLRAIADHARVCQFADSIVDRSKHPDQVELYEVILTLQAGEQVAFGKGNNTSLVVPITSGHPQELSKEHIVANYINSDEVKARAIAEFPRIQQWAKGFNSSANDASDSESGSNGNNGQHRSQGDTAPREPKKPIPGDHELYGMISNFRDNGRGTWCGFDLTAIGSDGEPEGDQFCVVFYKHAIAPALNELQDGVIGTFHGKYDDDKFVVGKWVLGEVANSSDNDAHLPF